MPKKVLLLIDCQVGFCNSHTDHLPPRWGWALREFGHRFDQVIAARWVNVTASAFMRAGFTAMHRDDPAIDLVPEVAPLITVTHDRSMYPVPGHILPRSADGPTEVFIAGVDTDACVMATALSLYTSQYSPVVIEDLSGSTAGPQVHEAALTLLRRNLGPSGVRDTAAVLDAL